MAIDNRDIQLPDLRRFVPKDDVLASPTLSTKQRSNPKQTPIPTSIITDPHEVTAQAQAVSLLSTSSHTTSSTSLRLTTSPSAAASTGSTAADSGSGISTSTLIISIVIPLVLIAILVPLVILLCLTCRRKRRRQNRRSNNGQVKPRSPERQKELLAHRPRGKYGPSMMMRRPNSFSGFEFNFSRPRTVLSRISVRSPTAVTPANASRSATLVSVPEREEDRPAMPRRPAAHLLSRYASRDGHIPTGRWDSPCSSPPPAFVRDRPMTLAHPFIPSPLKTPQIPDTPRSLSPQLQTATPIEIQRLSGPYTPISQVLRQPEHSQRTQLRPATHDQGLSPTEQPRSTTISANLQAPFVPSTSPAQSEVSGLSFDPSMWIAAYERDSVVNPVSIDEERRMDPHQMV